MQLGILVALGEVGNWRQTLNKYDFVRAPEGDWFIASARGALLSIFMDDRVMLVKSRILDLPRTVFFLGLTSFFNDFSSEMVASIFPAFFISVLKTGAESLGLVEGIADAASNLIKIYSGRWSDRIERRKVFAVAGYTLSVFTRPFYVLAGSVGAVIGLRLMDRIGKGLRDAPRDALISLSTPKEEIGRSFGYHRAMDTLGAIVGPLVAYVVLLYSPMAFNSVFIIAFIIGLLAVASLWLVQDMRQTLKVRQIEAFEGFSSEFMDTWFPFSSFRSGLADGGVAPENQRPRNAIASIPLFYASQISRMRCSLGLRGGRQMPGERGRLSSSATGS